MKHLSWFALVILFSLGIAPAFAENDPAVIVTGSVSARREVPLSFGMLGTVSEVLVEEGQFVHAGDVLARLDTADLELALRNAEAQLDAQQTRFDQLVAAPREVDVAAAQAALAAAQANANAAYSAAPSQEMVEEARLQTELARNQLWQAQLQRDQVLDVAPEFRQRQGDSPRTQEIQLDSGLEQADLGISIAETQYQGVVNEGPDMARLGTANASIIQAQVQLDRLVNGPDVLERQMAEVSLEISTRAVENARLQLDDAVIVAPFDGIITADNLVVGELPPQSQPALELADTSAYYVDLMIDETDVVYVEIGQPVQLTLDALPDLTLVGHLSNIALLPASSEVVPTYRTEITLDQTDPRIRIGMSAEATIQPQEAH